MFSFPCKTSIHLEYWEGEDDTVKNVFKSIFQILISFIAQYGRISHLDLLSPLKFETVISASEISSLM
jgi:hypothetical protein